MNRTAQVSYISGCLSPSILRGNWVILGRSACDGDFGSKDSDNILIQYKIKLQSYD